MNESGSHRPPQSLAPACDAAATERPKRSGSKSLIAGANAWMRAKETARAGPDRILADPWAQHMAERDIRIQAIRLGRFVLPPLYRIIDQLQIAHCVRHASIDALVCRAVEEDGFEQVVTVGAGYDMRPHRFAPRLPSARWFECDLPSTQARKRALVSPFEGPRVERAGVDLRTDSLVESLLAATSFDTERPTVFVLEGLIHYLSLAQLESLFAQIASASRRVRMVFSFIRTDMYERRTGAFVALIKAVREIPKLHFSPAQMAARCARHRLVDFRSWTFRQQRSAFVPQTTRSAPLSQDVAQVDAER